MTGAEQSRPREAERRARLEALYAAYATAVHAYARRRVESANVDDVVAETFLAAWRRLGDIPAHDPLPWLYATARHVVANQRRGDARRIALRVRVAAERPVTSAVPAGLSDDGEQLLRALARLRPGDREALLLIAWEGLEPARAAAALGCSRAALHVRVHRARRRLREALERERAAGATASVSSSPTPQEA